MSDDSKKSPSLFDLFPYLNYDLAKEKVQNFSFEHSITNVPCFRKTLLSGIVGGAGFGAIMYILKSDPRRAAKWAFGGFYLNSMGTFYLCSKEVLQEKAAFKTANHYIDEIYKVDPEKKKAREDLLRRND